MNRLVQFLYLLGRDELPLGAVETIMARLTEGPVLYSNAGLEQWARETAALLAAKADA